MTAASFDKRKSDEELRRRASAHAHYANGVILELQNNRTQSLIEFRQAALLSPGNEEMVWEVSRKFVAARQLEVAVELLTRAANRPEASGLTWARLGTIELQSDNVELALRAGEEAVRRSPSVLQGYQVLFLAKLQAGDFADARSVLEDAAAQEVEDQEFLVQLSELYGLLVVHDPSDRDFLQDRRLSLLEKAAAGLAESDMLRFRMADGFADIGQNERAAEIYQQLLETMPDAPGARDLLRSKLTEVYLRGKDATRAREQLEELLKRDPTNVRACYLLGSFAYEGEDFEAARDYFKRVTLLRPEFEQAYYDLAGVMLNLDQVDQADEVIAQARHKFPQSFPMELLSGMVHLRREEAELALPHFTTAEITAQALDPERLTYFFYFQFAVAAEQAADSVAAERHLKKCLELNPDFHPAQNFLGYMWAEQGINLHDSLDLIEEAVAAEPENAAYLDSLGWVFFKLERQDEALAALLKAVDLLEEPDAVVYDHLGDVYRGLHQQDKAVEAWKKSHALDPTDAVRQKLEEAGHPVEPDEAN